MPKDTKQLAQRPEPTHLADTRRELAAALLRIENPMPAAERHQMADLMRKVAHGGRATLETAIDALHASADTKLALQTDIAAVRVKLGYFDAPFIEQLLIDQVAICYLRVMTVEQTFSRLERDGVTLEQGAYWQRKLSAAQTRYLRSLETLARVRKLIRPMVQVNVATHGGQQVIGRA